MDSQPEGWISAIGAIALFLGLAVAALHGWSNATPTGKGWDLFKLGEIYEEGPYYKPSPTNIMREIDRAEKKKIKKG